MGVPSLLPAKGIRSLRKGSCDNTPLPPPLVDSVPGRLSTHSDENLGKDCREAVLVLYADNDFEDKVQRYCITPKEGSRGQACSSLQTNASNGNKYPPLSITPRVHIFVSQKGWRAGASGEDSESDWRGGMGTWQHMITCSDVSRWMFLFRFFNGKSFRVVDFCFSRFHGRAPPYNVLRLLSRSTTFYRNPGVGLMADWNVYCVVSV